MSSTVPPSASRPGKPRQASEAQILKAARQAFARHGYKGTSMSEIATEAQLPKANLHYYFSSKQCLYEAVLAPAIQCLDAALAELQPNDDPATALQHYINARLEFARQAPLTMQILNLELASGGEQLSRYLGRDYTHWFRKRLTVLEYWISEGRLPPMDPLHLLLLIWNATQATCAQVDFLTSQSGRPRIRQNGQQAFAEQVCRTLLIGLGLQTAEIHQPAGVQVC